MYCKQLGVCIKLPLDLLASYSSSSIIVSRGPASAILSTEPLIFCRRVCNIFLNNKKKLLIKILIICCNI